MKEMDLVDNGSKFKMDVTDYFAKLKKNSLLVVLMSMLIIMLVLILIHTIAYFTYCCKSKVLYDNLRVNVNGATMINTKKTNNNPTVYTLKNDFLGTILSDLGEVKFYE
jgi:capsular polysaccharide biosynthesis protein